MNSNPPITVAPAGSEAAQAPAKAEVVSPDCPIKFSEPEQQVWDYICDQLRKANLLHLTAGIAISVIVKKYRRWLTAIEALDEYMDANGGSFQVKTPNGYQQPHQLVHYVDKQEKELLKWLPSCCLTIPTFAKVKALENGQEQGDLFLDEIRSFMQGRPS
ncbi:P27 family phage terminase small subunit [Pseudomonas sp.]|uniref:P27 family phage terminase small subunit n=1 Tax=Pseudomonas sp. TaxID=306 RepID=UPI002730D27A|nr:P27 family phage terminase small subunit [Pseudomonas sp.]MDP2447627.1 P27 family phage terminase small subunit [Pseudomonas sp.]MDZ4334288.1 P27 family phage terminase small subunit [Pseudomonas sp.]